MIYLGIFIFKIIEDSLATLRLIVVSNGKKLLGSILQFICTIIWIILTGTVLINFMNDFNKVIAFSIGSFFGSYLGSFIEEKLALGTNSIIIKKNNYLNKILNNYNYIPLSNDFIMIIVPRKKTKKIIKTIKKNNQDATIIIQKIKTY